MLWYKAWLETRLKILFLCGWWLLILFLAIFSSHGTSPDQGARLIGSLSIMPAFFAVMLGGAGIKTQAALTATKGLHGSMYFTLSLPVTRLRLLAVRAGLGMLETFGAIGAVMIATWIVLSPFRMHITPFDALEYWAATSICVVGFYALSVLLATFLDDVYQIWGSLIAIVALRLLSSGLKIPRAVNIFQAMGESSPLFTHTLPWTGMGTSLGMAVVFFVAAATIVQAREY